ncbi:16 kDa beta-galactoside-binding lectin [Anolis carolinensis]|uniref:Galectin n=1 Tax=Anolis carolinensis TaxID=28377 RepID=A0A803TL03_ANOCA|nr:PREDICTED: 16 kDa beta-galactoside-binding lectin [Anolis carolinensis]|eukprot:XP_003221874.1 PREDICTED: 16 kDa beta-galactoside-binding lectin [Anolis carolinensis]
MECGVVATHLKVCPGEAVQVEGKILPGCKGFEVNLGKNCENLVLHFNPRFDCKGDANTIVCNSRRDGVWEDEERDTHFPFEQDSNFKVSFTFDTSEIKVKLEDGHEIPFPNRLGLDVLEYVAVEGDFKIQVLRFA